MRPATGKVGGEHRKQQMAEQAGGDVHAAYRCVPWTCMHAYTREYVVVMQPSRCSSAAMGAAGFHSPNVTFVHAARWARRVERPRARAAARSEFERLIDGVHAYTAFA